MHLRQLYSHTFAKSLLMSLVVSSVIITFLVATGPSAGAVKDGALAANGTQSVAPLPRVRTTADAITGSFTTAGAQSFTLRGANFVRLTTAPTGGAYHSTFEPDKYDALIEYAHRIKKGLAASADKDAVMTIGFYTNGAVGKTSYDGFKS